MTTLFEQLISQNTRCFACGSLVYAVEKKMTTNHIYHNRCFRCRICKRNLTGYSLNEEGDDIYCGNCYRKKQRGDCNSLDFHRAAAEKAQYIHHRHHPDQYNTLNNSRTPTFRDISRHPSLTLRQLERQFLSYSLSNTNDHNESTNEKINEKSFSTSHPLTISTNFSIPINLPKLRGDSPIIKNQPSPQFSTIRTETTIAPCVIQQSDEDTTDNKPTGSATGGIEFRLNKSSIDLTNVISPQTTRKNIIIPDLNQDNEQKKGKFRSPDFKITSIRRRSSSANRFRDE